MMPFNRGRSLYMTAMKIVEINDVETWEKTVEKSSEPVLVMFHSPSCPHCHAMDPYFQSYADEFKDKVMFVKVNVKDNLTIATKYGVLGTPTFKLFCKGRPIQDAVGEIYPSLIKKIIEDGLSERAQCVDKASWIYPDINGYS